MKRNPKAAGKQRGFTLVEMSVTMAAAGLLFSAVTTGQELIDQAKATKLINDVKTVEMQIQQYAQLKSRMPGDCDADGVIDYAADANATASVRDDIENNKRAIEYAYTVSLPTIPADGAEATAQTAGCALMGSGSVADVATSLTNANVWLNDLKLAGVVSDSASNRKLAKLVHEDFMFVGNVTDNGGAAADGADYNAIVIHNVPQWMARRLATSINGQDSRADRTRVRLLQREDSTDGTYSSLWQSVQMADDASSTTTSFATRDGMVTVVYFFDRIPESKMGATTVVL